MTTYRAMDGISGRPGVGSSGTQPPAAGAAFSGNYGAGLVFEVTQGGTWFQGYWWWVPSTVSQTTAQKFALWQGTGAAAGTVVAGGTVTSGTLTAGAFNFVALPSPLLLTPGVVYVASTAFATTAGFPDTQHQFGSANPYAAGIVNGPLTVYSSLTGSNPVPSNWFPQSPFQTTFSDPTSGIPGTNDLDDILWLDVQVSDVAPAGATYRAFPNMPVAVGAALQAISYTLGMEFSLTAQCSVQKIWHYSEAGSTILPTRTGIWTVASQTELAGSDNSSPTWLLPGGGAATAGAGWIYVDYSGTGLVLSQGVNYKISTFANAGASQWFGALANYWSTGPGANGITVGPLVMPNNAGATPGQNSWNQGTVWTYPNTSTNPENDWVDIEVLPVAAAVSTPAFTYVMRRV